MSAPPAGPPIVPSFRRLYLSPENPLKDSPRLRRRFATLVSKYLFSSFDHQNGLGHFMEANFGLSVPHFEATGGRFFLLEQFFLQAEISDVLEGITAIGRYYKIGPMERRTLGEWVNKVRQIFAEERIAYRVDNDGVVHPLVDQAFEAARVAAIVALSGDTFNAARMHFEDAVAALEEQPPDARRAVRDCFDAAENLFKMLTGTRQDLTKQNIENTLRPIIQGLHSGLDQATQQHAARMLSAFGNWADAGHPYRHAQAGTEVQAPTAELAVLYLNTGAGYVRWLSLMVTGK